MEGNKMTRNFWLNYMGTDYCGVNDMGYWGIISEM